MRFINFKMRKSFALLLSTFSILALFYTYVQFKRDVPPSTINSKKLLAAGIDLIKEAGKRIVDIRLSPYINVQQKSVGKATELLTAADITSHKVIKFGLASTFPGLKIISEEHAENDENLIYLPNLDSVKLPDLGGGEEIPMSDVSVWIDPLDATQEYSENLTEYVTIMMCVVRKEDPIVGIVYKPFEKKLYWAYHGYEINYSTASKQPKQSANDRKPKIIVSRSHSGDVKDVIKKKFGDTFDVITAGGSGFKAVELLEGRADAYLHRTSIKKWDTCALDALLHISGYKVTDLRGSPIRYSDPKDYLIRHGLLATRGDVSKGLNHSSVLEALRGSMGDDDDPAVKL